MEMVATEEIESIGVNLTPALSPLAYSLHDSFLDSHCAYCFSLLPPSLSPLPPNPNPSPSLPPLLYCSPSCSSSHSPLHLSSATHHLRLHIHLSQNPYNDQTSDLRVALLLLLQIKRHHQSFNQHHRIHGLMSNHHQLLSPIHDDELSTRIKIGARAIAAATGVSDSNFSEEEYLLAEAVLCVVLTNAVEVTDGSGLSVGIAVYDTCFSWINHSCSPNATYDFFPPESHAGGQRCLITPASSNGGQPITNPQFLSESTEISGGPRLVVSSLKPIKRGEQVTITYTYLLQPKEARQMELWSNYRFTCCCDRCVALPPTHVDQCLQMLTSASDGRLLNDVGIKEITEYINDAIEEYNVSLNDDAIDEYVIPLNDAESCCKKLENILLNGFQYEEIIIRLPPQHYLSLNAFATLASAYEVRSMDENSLHALKMKRFSAAYSLLSAVVTHDFFLNESWLIHSVLIFWVGAGESLLDLARSLEFDCDSELQSFRCLECGLVDVFEANFDDGQSPNKVLDISKKFIECITSVLPKVWKFLVDGNEYLEVVKDPLDLLKHAKETMEDQERVELYRLGVHFLLYGGVLMNICGGQDSHLSRHVHGLVHDGDGKAYGE